MKKVFVINSQFLGKGNKDLGQKLMGAFLRKLWAKEKKPDSIILYNSAVKLIASGSTVLDAMEGLFVSGVDILACGTCVDYFSLSDQITVGRISNMEEITDILMTCESVVTI